MVESFLPYQGGVMKGSNKPIKSRHSKTKAKSSRTRSSASNSKKTNKKSKSKKSTKISKPSKAAKSKKITKKTKRTSAKRTPARLKSKVYRKETVLESPAFREEELSLQQEKELIEASKTTTVEKQLPQEAPFSLPVRYGDNRIALMARDPWWVHTYWDISEERINEVISSIPIYERQDLFWTLRVYDVTEVRDFQGNNANRFFDINIRFEAGNWYINVNQPEREWCVEIGFKNPAGKFFAILRSNFIKTPYFGISSVVDEEWILPDDEYFKILGAYDLGKSSLERKRKVEEFFKQQISSAPGSWGISSPLPGAKKVKDEHFLEVWTELILYGRTDAGAELTVEGKKVNVRKDGTFSLRYTLPEGDFKFKIKSTSKNKKHKITKTPAVKRYNKK